MTPEATLICPDDEEWAEVAAAVPHDVYHLADYVQLEARQHNASAVAYVYREGSCALLVPLLLSLLQARSARLDAASPYGYPGPVSNSTDAGFWQRGLHGLTQTLGAAGVVTCFLRLHPLLPPPAKAFATTGSLVQHGETVAVDLRQDTEEIWRQVRSNHRRHINRAERDGRRLVVDDWTHFDAFQRCYDETMCRVGADAFYRFRSDYFTGLRDALGAALHLAVVLADDEVIAGALVTECGGLMQYHLGGAADGHFQEHPMKFLLHSVGAWSKDRGKTWLHLGGGLGGEEDSLFHFKAGFSAQRFSFSTARIVVDQAEYERLSGLPPCAGPFPSYRWAPSVSA